MSWYNKHLYPWQTVKQEYPRDIYNPPTRGKMHRCRVCWAQSEQKDMDNGFISFNERYKHAGWCPHKGDF